MTEAGASFALGVLAPNQRAYFSRDREVFKAFIRLHAQHYSLMPGLFRLLCHMCTLQPPEFIFVSLGLEIDLFVRQKLSKWGRSSSDKKNLRTADANITGDLGKNTTDIVSLSFSRIMLKFVPYFYQRLCFQLCPSYDSCIANFV